MSRLKTVLRFALVGALFLMAPQAQAYVIGTIFELDATAGGNLGLRVTLDGGPVLCSANQNWAYLEPTDSNFNWFASVLLTAYIQRKTVVLTAYQDGSYCHIQYVAMQG